MESFVLFWQGQTDVDTTLVKLQSLLSTKNYHELLIQNDSTEIVHKMMYSKNPSFSAVDSEIKTVGHAGI